MDRCGEKRSRFHFPACRTRSPQPPHCGLSAFIRHYRKLKHLQAYFWALPTPVLSDGDIVEVQSTSYVSVRLTWDAWCQDPIKAAVLRAVLSCQSRIVRHSEHFHRTLSVALGQKKVCPLHYSLLKEEGVHYLNGFRIAKEFMVSSLP